MIVTPFDPPSPFKCGVSSMAKGGYPLLLDYPDNEKGKGVDVNALIDAVEITGGACLMILHDRDVKDDGTPKENHYHVLIMWEKEVMEWENNFKRFMMQYHLKSPKTWYDNDGKKRVEEYDYYTAKSLRC